MVLTVYYAYSFAAFDESFLAESVRVPSLCQCPSVPSPFFIKQSDVTHTKQSLFSHCTCPSEGMDINEELEYEYGSIIIKIGWKGDGCLEA